MSYTTPGALVSLALCLGLLAPLGMFGCADLEEAPAPVQETTTRAKKVVVVPEFSIKGVDTMPESLYLTELSFVVSEIRLEPLTGANQNIAYSVVTPQIINFDVTRNQTVRLGQPIDLPQPGRYLVSLRLEPASQQASQDTGMSADTYSFAMTGFIAQQASKAGDEAAKADGSEQEGPIPHPFDGTGEGGSNELTDHPEALDSWTLFHYHTERASFVPINEVEFAAGEQHLSFNFDVQHWAGNIIEPISRAVRNSSAAPILDESGVDISRQLDSTGHGAESLLETGIALRR